MPIVSYIEIEIYENDGLPTNICHRCLHKTENSANFRKQCLSNDAKLRQIIELHEESAQINNRIKEEDDYNEGSPTDNYDGSNSDVETYPAENGDSSHIRESSLHNKLTMNEYKSMTEAYENSNVGKYHGLQYPQNEHVESVVMVVDPSLDYDSSDQSDYGQSDTEENVDIKDIITHDQDFKNVFMCKYCDIAFRQQEGCLAHECTEHDPNSPFSCNQCPESFPERNVFIAHMKTVHDSDKPFVCIECGKGFGRRSDLRKHTIVHTGVRPFTCPICMKAFSRNTNLTKHIRIHSAQKSHVCIKCAKTFISKADLSRHMLTHVRNKPFQCTQCNMAFARRDKLQRHEKTHTVNKYTDDSENDNENLVINIDPFQSTQYDDASGNLDQQNDNPEFSTLPSIPDHISGESQELQHMMYNPFTPHITGDDLFDAGDIKAEKSKVVKFKKSVACHMCPKKFSTPDSLRNHMNLHLGIREFVCEVCSKGFVRKRELERHSVVHTGFKPFECTECDKKFGRKDKLVRHLRIHSDYKGFHCEECPSSFNRKDGLLLHKKSHVKL